jgi:hypothetical protein
VEILESKIVAAKFHSATHAAAQAGIIVPAGIALRLLAVGKKT